MLRNTFKFYYSSSSLFNIKHCSKFQLKQLDTRFTKSSFCSSRSRCQLYCSSSLLSTFCKSSSVSGSLKNCLGMSTSPATKSVEESNMGEKFQRLPEHIRPAHYNISLQPNLTEFTFTGSEYIELDIKKETNNIVVNASNLEVGQITYQDEKTGVTQDAINTIYDKEKEIVTFEFKENVPVGKGMMRINFTGILNDKMKGFYKSKYKGEDGNDRYNAVTQFEATDARQCFPCFDEPAIKATFDITLIIPKNLVGLSNMPIKKVADHDNKDLQVITYDRTPIMSTYLLAFIVGEFDFIEATSGDGVLCRVYTQPGKKEQGRFALEVTTKVLPYYKEYFGVSYPLKKMDLVAIADFSSGAMENWGLVTYRESCLLVDPKESSASSKQWVAIVVAHELAHQWFGNLVTMEWWTHLWLNEGYASFVEYLATDYLFPEYNIWTQYVNSSFICALELDALQNSHAIEIPVEHPSEIDEIFDDISYNKGSCVIRMLHNYIGDDAFRKGMNIYLNRHQYKNAFTEDLWDALGEASQKPIGNIMSTWTKQKGFPLINVECKVVGNDHVFNLEQIKFCADPNDIEGKDYMWMIPISFSTETGIVKEVLMDKKEMEVTISNVKDGQWIKINPDAKGFYRVLYKDPEMLNKFVPAIKNKSMSPIDRLHLLDDLSALVQAGKTSTSELLKFLEAYEDETDYSVWASINNIMAKLNCIIAYTDFHDEYKLYGQHVFSKIEESVGWTPKENEGHLDALLRALVLGRMANFGHKKTIEESNKRFNSHLKNESLIPADLRSVVYRGALSQDTNEIYESMVKLYRDVDLHEEKDRIGRSFGALKNPELLKKALDFSVSADVRPQDSVFIILGVSSNKVGRELAWNFLKENSEMLQSRYSSGHLLARLVKCLCENFATDEKAKEISDFFEKNPFRGTERSVQQAVESTKLNAQWLNRDKNQIEEYFKTIKKT